jgi:hypothetical protein
MVLTAGQIVTPLPVQTSFPITKGGRLSMSLSTYLNIGL